VTASNAPAHPRAAAVELVLYHVVHPTDSDRDEWTQNYIRARAFYVQFERDYGTAHLHREIHHAGQYDAECLMHTETKDGF
jgi:hypothetical protein